MRKALRLLVASLVILLALPPTVQAQQRTVTGTVISSETKEPLAGVTVRVRGSKRITQTDANGNFSVQAAPNETLEFSYVGYETIVASPGGAALAITMKPSEGSLGEVVVTALDIKRNPRELGYSVQKVSGAEVAETQRDNFLNSMVGRVAGLTVNPTGGQAGSSTSIVLRGFNSMALDNQPLFVVDGVIVDNSTVNETSGTNTGLGLVENSARNINQTANRNSDYTNRVADINPNDIESITVLKGPEATALYGSQASSGAIIITTKKGRSDGRLAVNYDNAFRVSTLTRFPQYSTKWSPGRNGVFQGDFYNFGPAIAPEEKTYDNVRNFFQTGFAQTHNLSADFGKKNYSFRASGSYFNESGVVPENKYKRYTARLTNNTRIGKFLEITPSATYIHSENDKPKRGAGSYMLNLLLWPVTNDVRNYINQDGTKDLLYAVSPNSEIDNPFFSVNFNRGFDETDRYIGTLGVNLTPLSWLTIAGRFGYDYFKTEGWSFFHPMSSILTKGIGGQMDNYYVTYKGYNHTITATAKKNYKKFTGRLMGGTMWQDYRKEMFSVFGTNLVDSVNTAGQMMKNGAVVTQDQLWQWVGDSSATRPNTRQYLSRATKTPGEPNYVLSRQLAFFGEASLSYDNMVFLTYSHRFETSSIFPKDFRSYNYPAGSVSFIVSDIFPVLKQKTPITYFKLRTSLASTARSSAPYANQSVFTTALSSGGGFYYGFTNNNFFLEPEIQKTYEIGGELRLFRSKFGLDVTFYNTLNEKQIAENFRASYGTGFVLNTINVGSTRNKGIEIAVDANVVQNTNFSWNTRLNFNKMWNEVLSLPDNVPEFYISDTWVFLNARGGLIKGGPTTAITAWGYARNNNGDILIDPASGFPVVDNTFKVRGDRNPDFTLGWINNMSYKNWRLSFVWDLKVGGDIFNATDMYLTQRGVSSRTDDRLQPRVIKGVLKDGRENTANPTQNTIVVIPAFNDTYYGLAGGNSLPEEEFIEKDVNWFRMRDISLNYTLPSRVLNRWKFVKSLSVFTTANNLILFTNYTGADPAVSGNTAGTRGVGGWGFDYGNIGAPIALNFGFRAGF